MEADRDTITRAEKQLLTSDTIRRVAPLFEARSERTAWASFCEIATDLTGADLAIVGEFTSDERAVVTAGFGFPGLEPGLVLPVAPGSHAAYTRDFPMVMTSNDLPAETRFEPSPLLVGAGIRSSMTMGPMLPSGMPSLLGVHAFERHRFDPEDAAAFEALGAVFGETIGRLRTRTELERSARVDELTGLMNRASVLEHLDALLADGRRPNAMPIDIDGFKAVNDTLGHQSGDVALRAIARRLERATRPGDRIGRLGGDEFLLVSEHPHLQLLGERMIGHVEEVILVDGRTLQLSASIGIARHRRRDDASQLLERSDRMMYEAKAAGRGEVRVDADATSAPSTANGAGPNPGEVDAALTIDGATVAEAIAGLRMVVQPIIDPIDDTLHGVEALARGPEGHALEFPDKLFSAATTHSQLGDLELAAKRLSFELAADLDEGTMLYINLEPALASSEFWIESLVRAWTASGRHPSVTVELTERAVLRSPGRLLHAVDVCRGLGWHIALDDVGSRSESLAAIRWVDPDVVKLDMRLIAESNSAHAAHVAAAVAAYRESQSERSVRVIAEGVETPDDARAADVLGADLLQGYLFGRPAPLADLDLVGLGVRRSELGPVLRRDGDRVATKRRLIAMTRQVEASALSADAVVVASLQTSEHLTERTRRQYEGLAKRCGFAGLLGVGMLSVDDRGLRRVRLADLEPDDPLTNSWRVVAMSPTSSIGLLATQLEAPPGTADMDRLFSYRIITDSDDVEVAARQLLRYF
ncbi:MAG: EAL domain-containing protein [Ilumatobacter sp.]